MDHTERTPGIAFKHISKIILLMIVCGIIALSIIISSKQKASAGNIIVQGSLQVTETDLNSILAGTIKEVCVKEGDWVKKGDVIIRLDSESVLAKQKQAKAAITQAQAGYDASVATYNKALNGTRPEEVAMAQSAYEYAKTNYERMKTLFESEAVSKSDFDSAKYQYEQSKAKYEEANNGARSEDIAAAKAAVEAAKGTMQQAKGALDEVNSFVEDSSIVSSMDGYITSVNVNQGELISTGMTLASVADYSDAWVEVNVDETYLNRVSEGSKIPVSFLAFPNESFEATVRSVNKNPDFAVKRATNNNGEFDVLSYGVKIDIPDVGHELYPGMTVVVDFGSVS
jgi:HlyD family secretion protein